MSAPTISRSKLASHVNQRAKYKLAPNTICTANALNPDIGSTSGNSHTAHAIKALAKNHGKQADICAIPP
jgi:hypothetical protein